MIPHAAQSLIYFLPKEQHHSWVCWCTMIIPTLGRLRQEDHEFKTSLNSIVSLPKEQTKNRGTKDLAQLAKCLLVMQKVLGSVPRLCGTGL